MRSTFPLFQSHLDLAHRFWKELLNPGDTVIDATCGNGQDSLVLARHLDATGKLYLIDIQSDAIKQSRDKLSGALPALLLERVEFIQGCHSQFPGSILPSSVRLVVYNLGYLPGGDKALTTVTETTLKSMSAALDLLIPGGALSITCYPGHCEGKREEEAILNWAADLDPKSWSSSWHRWLNRRASPSWLLIQKQQAI